MEYTGVGAAGPAASTADKTAADYYFDSYAHHGIHEEMLKDTVRTESYRDAILKNPHLLKDKVVMDVGCGTGILSMFCAQAGAKHVYAMECSAIVEQARKIAAANGFGDKITFIQGKVEEVELPDGVEQIDVIVSEWMGYFLLYESMLNTVIFARDKWLAPDGVILPDKAIMYIAALEDGEYKREKLDFWNNVYGFDMSCIRELALVEPLVDTVDPAAVVTEAFPFKVLDMKTVTVDDLTFSADFALKVTRDDYCHGFVSWFDCEFSSCHKPVAFSTGPDAPYTHWKSTVLYANAGEIMVSTGEIITGTVSVAPNATNPRDLDIALSFEHKGRYQETVETMEYKMR
ncbi:PRMT-1 protein [Thecamonas trahens ATCC 50062]|uniref:PRMT-1 protein n=1 Tax=Thecamonas trahens ATCC 50062 TaxID=461836 RepID=A0A0L0D5F6_THETB|nr:PRMT-1 protein [Thecamonas trahens ATCC 50062]KNC47321.1 PRMT-1 protein [Thecamonas trahens ATCC 50062]|eukprot:XP_013759659.1 PRMT-1 protein [Thecamonas trahens ATCC 50062]